MFNIKKSTLDFNKEILFGEIGALIGAPFISFLVSRFTKTIALISASAVIGALIGGSVFWLFMRIYDEEKKHIFSMHHLEKDILYFTPAAFLSGLLVYQPILFFLSDYFLSKGEIVVLSVLASQVLAFSFFLTLMNIYRKIVNKYFRAGL